MGNALYKAATFEPLQRFTQGASAYAILARQLRLTNLTAGLNIALRYIALQGLEGAIGMG